MLRFSPALILAAAAASVAGEPVSFQREVAQLLQRRCAGCHGEDSAKGGYRLDSFAAMQKPGDSEAAPLVAGKARDSELFKLIITQDADERMPQKAEALPQPEIALLERWIAGGASYDGDDPARPLAELARATHLRAAPEKYPRVFPVTALAFSADGRLLASGGYREVLVWRTDGTTLQRRMAGLPERISGLAWSARPNVIAVAGGTPGQWGTVALVDAGRNDRVRFLCDLPEMALSVAFSPDGETLVAGCGDRTLRVFDVSSGKQMRVLRNHSDWVQCVAFNPAGTRLVSAGRDRTARVFDTSTWNLTATYTAHDTPLLAATFSADGARIVTTARGAGHVWQPAPADKRGELAELGGDAPRLASGPFGIAAGCADGTVKIYQVGGAAPWLTLAGHTDAVQALAVSGPGDLVASGGADGEVFVWSLACGTWLGHFRAAP
jgi:mono/diheme cytochrome c family protein